MQAIIENRPEGLVVVDGDRLIPADDREHAERILIELERRRAGEVEVVIPVDLSRPVVGIPWPRWRVKRLGEKVRVDNGRGELRVGELVVWEGQAASMSAAMTAASESPLGLDLKALARFRGQP